MIRIREGELSRTALTLQDVERLKSALGRDAEVSRDQILVRRLAGLWPLPSGEVLVVDPRKGTGADLFAWMCAVDPRLVGQFRALAQEGASHGSVGEVAVRTLCTMLVALLRRAGARHQYAESREMSLSLRGRVDWAAFAREPLPIRLPCIYWSRRMDTPLNRLLSAALRAIRTNEILSGVGAGELQHLLDVFGHVPASYPQTMLDLERPLPRGDAAYEAVRRLAIVILESMGLAHGGTEAALGFQLDLARLFERSVECAILTRKWATPPKFQMRPPYQGDRDEWSAIDALVHTEQGAVVVDAKYAAAFSKAHLYQVLAYMKMVGARRGALIYPAGSELRSRCYRGVGDAAWEVRVLELDVVRVGTYAEDELSRLGAEVVGT